ncbi:MAG: NUDIX domain-containing protein [Gammaproteobacteria bacterium]|jgi:8-oxo-dGTP pyrophosphatase MutT (NUDIX family)
MGENKAMSDHQQNLELSAGGTLLDWSSGEPKLLALCMRNKLFELPKGHIEQGETAQAAALREFHEETGLIINLKVASTLGELTYTFMKYGHHCAKKVVYFIFEPETPDLVDLKSLTENSRRVHWLSQYDIDEREWVSSELKNLLKNELVRLVTPSASKNQK